MLSGDHLLGRTVLFFDYGHTPDPVGEFLASLSEIEPLAVDLCLPGHGRPFRDPEQKIAEARAPGRGDGGQGPRLAGRRGERTAFEIVAEFLGPENLDGPASAWVLQIVLALLDHLALAGEVAALRGNRSAPLGVDVAFGADGKLHLRARGGGAAADRLRRPHRPPPLRRDHAAAPLGARARGGAGAQRRRRDPRPRASSARQLREEVVAYEPPTRFSYTVLSGAPVRDHLGTVELTPTAAGTRIVYAVRTDADAAAARRRSSSASSSSGSVSCSAASSSESERRAAADA